MAEPMVTPVAVIGMACRLPGGIDSPEQLWEALLRGADLVTEIPADRWDADEYYDPERGVPGRTVTRWGGFLDDPGAFDAPFFGFDDTRAIAIDPQHRLLMETSWEAVEHAGIDPTSLSGTRTGVYFGISHDDHTSLALEAGVYGYTETSACMASGRVAYILDSHGPAMTTDTACSSGLLAVHMAARSLATGESDLALAGGCEVMREPRKNNWASAQGMLSPTGRCKPFDESADGFVRSEGCAVVLLKRLPDALRDGDRILAVVRGTAANSDGRTRNIATPSVDAQVQACRAALEVSGIDPGTVGAVEAHGTGTPVGDPIEFTSLATTYGKTGTVLLGSAKSNFGHAEAAAGAMGFVKAVLELQHGVVPPMVHFHRMPEALAQIDTGLVVPRETTSWPDGHGEVRRIAISSYGISGTNVHAIVEQAPADTTAAARGGPAGEARPIVLSATSVEALRSTAAHLADWLERQGDPVDLNDLGYTLARRRGHRPVRTAVIAADASDAGDTRELCAGLREIAAGDTPYPAAVGQDDRGPVWVFSGQGSQWAEMGAPLLANEPTFAAAIARIEPLIRQESGFSVTEAMSAPETVTGIGAVQPTIFAMQVALAEAMAARGVRPGAVIGHSMGEVAAAVVTGALSLEDGVRVICRRSKLMDRLSGTGAMASVELPEKTVRDELSARGVDDVVVAVVASPQTTVIGGETSTIRDLVAHWEAREVMAREIAVDVASHSPLVDPILVTLTAELADLDPRPAEIPYYSATLVDPRGLPACDAAYWADNLRHTVRFAAAVQAALEDGYRVFAELSPHPLLTRAVEQTAQETGTPVAALASLRRDQAAPHGLLNIVCDLYAAGAAVDFAALYPTGRLLDVPLPVWTHHHLLLPGAESAPGHHRVAAHPLLGAHVRLVEEPERHAWQSDVGTAVLPWLADHRVRGVAALPGAAYCEMALTAADQLFGSGSQVTDVSFEDLLLLDEHTELTTVATLDSPDLAELQVQTDEDGERVTRAAARLHGAEGHQPSRHDIARLLETHPNTLSGNEIRQMLAERGIEFGPSFAGLVAVHTATGESTVVGEVVAPAGIRSELSGYCIHPAVLDACFQSVGAHMLAESGQSGSLLLPLSVSRLRQFGPGRDARYCYATITTSDPREIEADLAVLDSHGDTVLEISGLRMGSGSTKAAERERVLADRLLTVAWEPRQPPSADTAAAGDWLVIAPGGDGQFDGQFDGQLDGLPDALTAAGARCRVAGLEDPVLMAESPTDVVVVLPPPGPEPDAGSLSRGRALVEQVVRLSRLLADSDARPPRLYVVTRNARDVTPDDPINLDHGGLRGLLRVIGSEQPELRPTQIDVDAQTPVGDVVGQLLSGSEEDETAWRSGRWFVARLQQSPLRAEERRTAKLDPQHDRMRVQVRVPGDLRTLELVAAERLAPQPGQVEVEVRASSINFADVLTAFGRCPVFEGITPELGLDFTGVVTAVGSGVDGLAVGDRVGGVSTSGCWGNFVTCDARLVAPLPTGLTDEQAAAVTTGYATAWFGLHDLARIGPGDRVLIHSATGGVGQAAIAIARHAGAEIFATAGSPTRRQLLKDMGIEHVYDSRSTAFAAEIRRDTDGYGVDVVLNSLVGPAQRAGIELLAFGGRFVEIGKRDVYEHTRVDLYPFRRNLAFYYADLALMTISDPERSGALVRTVYQLVGAGTLPMPDHTTYPLSEAATAIRAISAAEHTGKLVLTMPPVSERVSVVVPPARAQVFRRDGSYIVTGGVGGLGLFLAAVMASGGCGRIVLTSRSQPNTQAQRTIERLRANGADIVVESGNIADPETAPRLVTAAVATGLPVRGVLHAAAVVDDATLANITDELIERDWAPKVDGAWYLHQAIHSTGQPLDWFCSFSSAAALLGSPGQGAYAAANSWLDAFTAWQRRQGVPAIAIAWGAWADIGRGAGVADRGDVTMIKPEDGAYAFRALLRHNRGYAGYLPVTGMPLLAALAAHSPFAEGFVGAAGHQAGDTSGFAAELAALPSDERPQRLRRLVTDQAGLILRRPIDPDRSFVEHGLDSLGMLELRTAIETQTGVRISPKTIVTHNTARSLAHHLDETLSVEAPSQ